MAFEDNKKFLSKILVIFELLLMAQSFVEGLWLRQNEIHMTPWCGDYENSWNEKAEYLNLKTLQWGWQSFSVLCWVGFPRWLKVNTDYRGRPSLFQTKSVNGEPWCVTGLEGFSFVNELHPTPLLPKVRRFETEKVFEVPFCNQVFKIGLIISINVPSSR